MKPVTVLHTSFIFILSFIFSSFLNYSYIIKKKEERVGGHYWQKVLHTGTGEKENPRATNGQAQKILSRPPQVGHKD